MTTAAFFDLDRTILGGGSGPIYGRALRELGLGPDREIPVVSSLFRVFDVIGESRTTMRVVRQGIRFTKGWSEATFREAGTLALDELIDSVQPYLPGLVELHRAARQRLVMATTTPIQLVTPLAEHLGFDDVVATRYEADEDGLLTGGIVGEFVWGRGKLAAVRDWAKANGVDVANSHAYSDSFFDAPLLDAVGFPVATNPDPRLVVLARLKGWPIRHLDKPPGVAKVGPFEIQDLVLPLAKGGLAAMADMTVEGEGLLPASGPAIVAANHRSYFDVAAVTHAVMARGRTVRFLGKREVFDAPIVGEMAAALGGIPVDRGTGSDEPLRLALDALAAGEVVVIMPQGTIPRGPAFFEPKLEGRYGVARLAAESGAPVIPLGVWGTEKVWPRSSKLPNVFPGLSRPEVTLRFGEPILLDGDDLAADVATVMAGIEAVLPEEARIRIDPTPNQLALTYPPGKAPSTGQDETDDVEL
jgi:putative phosphoserine phosphatase / 1-acylglycerol-3-phosphate O-acyltransferase